MGEDVMFDSRGEVQVYMRGKKITSFQVMKKKTFTKVVWGKRAIYRVDNTIAYECMGVASPVNEGKKTILLGWWRTLGPSSRWTRRSPTSLLGLAVLSMKARIPPFLGCWRT